MHPSVRSHLITGGAVASAGILALGLVAAPPDFNGARTEVRAVQLAALALPPAVSPAELLEEFISYQALTAAPVALAVPGGAADIATALVTTPRTFVRVVQPSGSPTQPIRATAESGLDPAISNQVVNNTVLASSIEPIDVFGLIFAAGFVVFFVAGIFVQYVLFTLFNVIEGPCCDASGLAVSGASTATVEENPPTAPTLTSDPPLQANETEKADVPKPVTSIDKRTRAGGPASTEAVQDVTETVAAEGASTEPATVSAPEPAGNAPEPRKPAVRPTTSRPVVRDSLAAETKTSDPSHRGNGGRATTEKQADHMAATVASSSADSSSAGSASSAGGSSNGDSGGSEQIDKAQRQSAAAGWR